MLIRSTLKPGLIKVRASVIDEGVHTPAAGELIFETVPAKDRMIYSEEGRASASVSLSVVNVDKTMTQKIFHGK